MALARRRGSSRGGTLGSARRQPDEARTSILAAAECLFYDEGVRAVSVDAVAALARVTKRTLYYHFASKDDLVAAYLAARDEATLAALRGDAIDGQVRPGDRILGVFDFVARWSKTSGYRGCPFNNAVAEQGASPKVAAIARRHKATVERWFTAQAGAGGAKRAAETGARLLVLLDGALNGAAVSGTSRPALVAASMAEEVLAAAGIARSRHRATKGK